MTYELGSRVTPVNPKEPLYGEVGTVVVDCGNEQIGVTWDSNPSATGFWHKDPTQLEHISDAPSGTRTVLVTAEEARRMARESVVQNKNFYSKGAVAYYGGLPDDNS